MEFMGISIWEFLLIVVVIIVVLGPNKIPGIMRTLGIVVRNIRKITSELTANVAREMQIDDITEDAKKRPAARSASRTSDPPEITPLRKPARKRSTLTGTAKPAEITAPRKVARKSTASASRTKPHEE